ncbi:MAG: MFS transporter [Parabacteroides sp.]|nr:MFS transporter [Parabacteroides sp.]
MNASRSLSSGKSSFLIQMIPVMLCFFAMGFVDLVGTASNYVQKDLGLTDAEANLFPSLVFFWFLIFAVPTGILMNRIGRKHTVLVSLVVTTASLILPIFGDSYGIMLAAFSFLGIGNAIMQTSLNPLVTNLISEDKLASTLTFGQFVKAIASFLAPILAAWGATTSFPTFGLGWRALFVIYAVFSFLSISMLAATPIEEEQSDKASGVGACLQLLRKPFIVLCFIGIMCHVGIDVGTNTTAPKILMERLSLPLEEAGIATSVYFIFRTIGCFTGAFVLSKLSARHFFGFSVALMLVAIGMLFVCDTLYPIYIAIGLIGFGNSNIFSIILSQALMKEPKERNEVSGLMIMGLFGGTVFPLAMGFAADALGQTGAIGVMSAGVAYLLYYTLRIK